MSDVIKSVFVNYIACALLGGFLEYFAPSKIRRTLRVAVIAVMLVTSVAPVLKIDLGELDFSGYEEAGEGTAYDALMHTANLTEKKIYGEIRDILINQGVDEYEIYVTTSVEQETNTVFLEEIKVETDERFKDKITDIENAVSKEYQGILSVVIKDGEK